MRPSRTAGNLPAATPFKGVEGTQFFTKPMTAATWVGRHYSTVTDFARFRGLSTSQFRAQAM